MSPRFATLLATLTLLGSGCVLGSPAEAPRFFLPPPVEVPSAERIGPLRLGLVTAPAYLKNRIVWRSSDVELGFYEQQRWIEAPTTLVEKALIRALFDSGAFEADPRPGAPVLEVVVEAFEERFDGERRAYLRLQLLHAGRRHRIEAERKINDDAPGAVARAMGRALADAAESSRRAIAETP